MSKYCEVKKKWDEMSTREKLEALKDLINETLMDEGVQSVDVETADLPGDEPGRYNEETNTVIIDTEHLEGGNFDDVVDTAYHEASHAIDDWESEVDTYVDEEWGIEIPGRRSEGDSEIDAHNYAQDAADEADEECEPPPESPVDDDKPLPPGDWNLPPSDIAYA